MTIHTSFNQHTFWSKHAHKYLQPIKLEKFTAHFNGTQLYKQYNKKMYFNSGITEQMYKHSTET